MHKFLLQQVQVKNPCTVSWDSMVGNDYVRFCEHCSLSVHNLSQLTHKQIRLLITKSDGRLCVQYIRRPDGSLVTNNSLQKLHRIGRRVSQVAAGAFTATLSVTGAAQQPSNCNGPSCNQPSVAQPNTTWRPGSSILGTVTDQNGARIPGATASVSNPQTGLAMYTSADWQGEYRFENLEAGSYDIRIEAPGFAPSEVKQVYISPDNENRLNQILRVAQLEQSVDVESGERSYASFGGAVAVVAPSDPFVRAAQQDDIDTLVSLLSGRDVNLRDKQSGTTALEHAVLNGNRELVQLLLSAGADVNTKNSAGETLLMMLDGDATNDLIWDLLNAGAKVNSRDNEGNTPLLAATHVDSPELIKTLLDAGADVNARNKKGETALMNAAAEGNVNVVRVLILAGSEINALDEKGQNALFYATDSSHTAAIRLLRAHGAIETIAVNKEKTIEQ